MIPGLTRTVAIGGRAGVFVTRSPRPSIQQGRDSKQAGTLIPPAFGLAGVNLSTWTGFGSVTYWNAYVAGTEMHGAATFFDAALFALAIPVLELLERLQDAGLAPVLLRLPYEVKDLFKAWLDEHYPLKASHVMSRVRDMRDGKEYDSEFGSRMRGKGKFAELLAKRFKVACQRLGLNRNRESLDTARFRPPQRGGQMALF